ncbi:DUF6600 domain-containing protein [Pontibacter beigongshangensis]|uniref:DUF6600 domain-containing protein n=1 Tax=Pontibacter beigongshangensis TaxID=2574733 RepID=UPI00164FBC6F|nr:DUF6600 domain-containing protein [Pontibacter beigongshangensis]
MVALVAVSLLGAGEAVAQGGAVVSFQTFYDELAPYGRWIQYPAHGYVWSPNVEPGFQPYATRGHWVMTAYGNTWVSDYRWGWAPFHYGRWLYDDFYGWLWVPGHEWGPAWVHWRTGGDYYGWAPLGPGMHINLAINIPMVHWVFVPRRYIMSPRIYRYCVPRTRVVNVYHNTTIINNYYYNSNRTYVYGPRANEIEQHTRRRVQVYEVNNDNKPGRPVVDRSAVRMYRPEVTSERPSRNEAPARVVARETGGRPDRGAVDGSQNRPEGGLGTEGRNNMIREHNTGTRPNPRAGDASGGNPGIERITPGAAPVRDLNSSYQPAEGAETQRPTRNASPSRPERAVRSDNERISPGLQPIPNMQEQAPRRRLESQVRTEAPVRREQPAMQPQRPQRQERPIINQNAPVRVAPQQPMQPQRTERPQRIVQPQRVEQPQRSVQSSTPSQRPAATQPQRSSGGSGKPTRNF